MSRSLDADSWGSLAASFAESAVVSCSREVAEHQLSQKPLPCHLSGDRSTESGLERSEVLKSLWRQAQ